MSDRADLLSFLRRAAKGGGSVGARQVGYLIADYDRLLTAARVVLDEDRDDPDRQRLAKDDLRRAVADLTT